MLSIVLPLVLLTLLAPVRALAWSENPTTPEGWAWKQIKAGKLADFNVLLDILTTPTWQNHVTRHGIRLRGAHVVEDIDLSNAEIVSEVWLDASLVAGDLNLTDVHLKRLLSFDGSVLGGALFAERLLIERCYL